MSSIRKVWIEEGCISCSLCQDICPDVFEVKDGHDCVVRADGPKQFDAQADDIREAARDCPVEVIHVEEGAASPKEITGLSPKR